MKDEISKTINPSISDGENNRCIPNSTIFDLFTNRCLGEAQKFFG